MELKFDEMAVDTTLAQEYLERYKQEVASDMRYMNNECYYYCGKYYSNITEIQNNSFPHYDYRLLKKLSEKLKEKIDLLAQVEYISRAIPIEDSKKQINLIIQQLQYIASDKAAETAPLSDNNLMSDIYMTNDAPLLYIGYIGKLFIRKSRYLIVRTEKDPSPICMLFVNLCWEVGLPVITSFEKNIAISEGSSDLSFPSLVGALGVICEQSDVDSAIDMLIESSAKAPWRLQRILVQESVCQQFRDGLKWKCNLDETSNRFSYCGRDFLLDELGTAEPPSNIVYVDTYRTIKELLTLLIQYPPYYLSLWANNIAEINEIVYSVRTPIVWVNNYADFRGPDKISEAIYPIFYPKCKKQNQKLIQLSKLKASWLKLTSEARRDIICDILRTCETNKFVSLIPNSIRTNNGIINVHKDFVCTVVTDVTDNLLFFTHSLTNYFKTLEFFESIIMGAAYAISGQTMSDDVKEVVGKLSQSNAPVVILNSDELADDGNGLTLDVVLHPINAYRTRVISMNSGTTFAN